MKINIAINYTSLKLDVTEALTIGELKNTICDKWPIADSKPSVEMISLLFSGKKLHDDTQTLADLKVKDNQKMTVMLNVMAAKIQNVAVKVQENKSIQVQPLTKQSAIQILDEPPTKILDYLYHSNLNQVLHGDFKNIKQLGITHIICLTEDLPYEKPASVIDLLHIPIPDEDKMDISKHFKQTNNFIDDAKRNHGKVLVHCHVGISRSITIVAAYLIKEFHYSAEEALAQVQEKKGAHATVEPNNGFLLKLKEYAANQ